MQTQLKVNYATISDWSKMSSTSNPPCDTMTIQTGKHLLQKWDDTKNYNYLNYEFRYEEDVYEEVTNKQDFGFGSFWSYVGGIAGIFLGYSLMQTPELFLEAIDVIQHLYK